MVNFSATINTTVAMICKALHINVLFLEYDILATNLLFVLTIIVLALQLTFCIRWLPNILARAQNSLRMSKHSLIILHTLSLFQVTI